ncbi:MAG: hypothetical protein MUO85_05810, partial [candidate division Zixibacteria bacterium]|nr:hypothetical protein [candidate division Zixibacteria bacterium]
MKSQGVLVILLAVIFFLGCAEEVTNPPEGKVTYAIADYFPLQIGDEWTWQVHSRDSIPEPYKDGDSCLGEPFTDVDGDGLFEEGIDTFIVCGSPDEPCPENQDLNYNGGRDGPDMCGQIDDYVPFVDFDGDNIFDNPDGQYNNGEPYLDLNNNGIRDYAKDFDLKMMVADYGAYSYYDGTPYKVLLSAYDTVGLVFYRVSYRNGFTVDSLGLRWHSHSNFANSHDILQDGNVRPIAISAESLQAGYSHTQADTFWADTLVWTSTLVGVENVTV